MPCGLMHHPSLAETDQGTAVGLDCSRPSLCSCVLHTSNTITFPSAWCCWPLPAAVGHIARVKLGSCYCFLPLQCMLPQPRRCSFHVKHSSAVVAVFWQTPLALCRTSHAHQNALKEHTRVAECTVGWCWVARTDCSVGASGSLKVGSQ